MVTQPVGYQATSQETSRVLTRGKLEFFTFEFFYNDAKTLPVTPLDPQAFPSYRILSPSGEMLAQGVAIAGGAPGRWKMGWVVPKTAELSNVHRRYRFNSVMVDTENRQFEVSFEFDVVESNIPAQLPKKQQCVTFVGEGIRLTFENTVRPEMLQVRVTPAGQDGTILHQASLTYPIPVTPTASDLREVQMENYFAYYTDTPAFTNPGDYSALWKVRDTATSEQDFEHTAIVVVTTNSMFMVRSLRMLIDRLQKKLGIVFAFTNEDMIEYVREGTSLMNGYWPPSNYTETNTPSALRAFVILAAAWWALQAQRVLYSETNLDFSGQTVTLGYNPASELDGVISSFKDTLDTQVPKAKKDISRAMSGVGALATRPYRYRSNVVFPISSGYGADIMHSLLSLGILD